MFRKLFFKKPQFFKTAKENYCSGVSTLLNDRARVGHNKPTFTFTCTAFTGLDKIFKSFKTILSFDASILFFKPTEPILLQSLESVQKIHIFQGCRIID